MKEFHDQFTVPPGGWWYEHPESKHVIRSVSRDKLLIDIKNYCAANNYPIQPNLSQLVIDQICERNPQFCRDTEPPSKLDRLRSFAQAMVGWMAQGFAVVPSAVLEERRGICETCLWWSGESSFGYGRCGKCGCTGLKLFLPKEKCPIDKWKAHQ